MTTKRITRLALLTAMALILSLIESALPPLLSFAPGVKIGLSNAVTLFAIITCGYVDAGIVLVIRCVMMALFSGNISSLMYSLSAGVITLALEILLYKFLFGHIRIITISLVGAIVHNITQVAIASLVVGQSLAYILPLTLIASVIAGLFIGITVHFTIKYLPKKVYMEIYQNGF